MAAWLGWQIESNWTDPFLFAVYSLVKPIASVLIIVVMYGVITRGDFGKPLFSYIYLGNAFYILVGRIVNGMAWAVIDDREHYKTLKYIYTSPVHFPSYLLGRSVAAFLAGAIAVFITLLFGVLLLQVALDFHRIQVGLFIVSLLLGTVVLTLMGMILASVMLLLAHHSWGIGEAVAGALYLFSGAIFPIDILPIWIRWFGYVLPVTYWLELIRRALIGQVAGAFPTFAALSNAQLLGILGMQTLLLALIAATIYRWSDRMARQKGLIDTVTNY